MATLEDQFKIEELYNKYNLIPCLREEVKHLKLTKFNEDLVIHLLIHKRADPSTMVGLLKYHGTLQEVADQLANAIQSGLVGWDGERLVTLIQISPELQREIDAYQFPLPLVVKPRKLLSNLNSGYYTNNSSVILKNNHHEFDVCLDHLNRMNSIPLSINEAALKVKNHWEGPLAPFLRFDTAARGIIKFLIDAGNKFYLTHKYDKRGRTYCVGYHVTYQGNDWQKAVVEFYNKEVIP